MSTEVAERPETAVQPAGMVSMIERLAAAPDFPVEKLEKLLEMQERIMAKQAETEFAAAMSAAQAEMGRISADAMNPQTRSKYASYAQLDRALRPIYTQHGFSLSFDEADSPKAEHIRVICHVSHRAGHTRVYHRDMPLVTKGLKGNEMMTPTHANASGQSYAQRYLLKGIFNVAVGEDDNDGNPPPALPTISDEQQANIIALIEEVGADKARFMKWARVTSLDQILAKNYSYVISELERKRKQ